MRCWRTASDARAPCGRWGQRSGRTRSHGLCPATGSPAPMAASAAIIGARRSSARFWPAKAPASPLAPSLHCDASGGDFRLFLWPWPGTRGMVAVLGTTVAQQSADQIVWTGDDGSPAKKGKETMKTRIPLLLASVGVIAVSACATTDPYGNPTGTGTGTGLSRTADRRAGWRGHRRHPWCDARQRQERSGP